LRIITAILLKHVGVFTTELLTDPRMSLNHNMSKKSFATNLLP
jgi:hypothetical protein